MQLLTGMSIKRYLPANGTAGLAQLGQRIKTVPAPPPRIIAYFFTKFSDCLSTLKSSVGLWGRWQGEESWGSWGVFRHLTSRLEPQICYLYFGSGKLGVIGADSNPRLGQHAIFYQIFPDRFAKSQQPRKRL